MGIGSILWVPLSLAIGRRAVFLLNTIILAGSVFWASVANNFSQLLIAASLQGLSEGFAASAVSSVVGIRPCSETDVFAGTPDDHRYNFHPRATQRYCCYLGRRRLYPLDNSVLPSALYYYCCRLSHLICYLDYTLRYDRSIRFLLLPGNLLHASSSSFRRPSPPAKCH